ncbi:hypothetical protein [Nocardiopsis lambiniae]|uniref:Uncharacterized protein n=1 Tax=Nocardiopsis lambiniae TaxID=3075539 RepID=A0ABU2MAI5_9ACTN|nr:hypothetical protein [Nocardiopsis sp. DSM 44743]MDT0329686.1 hypothetical protein [Nocardiopsis sp. DSM 44743]
MFHLPGSPSDLPHPEILWSRAGAYAAICAGLGLPHCVPERGAVHFSLILGSRFCLARVSDGRFLLIGEDRDSAVAQGRDRPIDPFDGAPDGLPREWLAELPRPDFVYWWDDGWSRADYPDDWEDDGLAATVGWCADLDRFTEWVALTALNADDVGSARATVADLVSRAEQRSLDTGILARVLGYSARPDIDVAAAMAIALRLGLTGEQEPEALPPGRSRPVGGGHPLIGRRSLSLLIGDAMRAAGELPGRGDPVTALAATATPRGRAEKALAEISALAREHLLGDADRRVLVYRAPHAHGLVHDDLVPIATGPGAHAILEGLRADEEDPERGRWLFARLDITRDDVVLERAYDHWPAWLPGPVDEGIRELGLAHPAGGPGDTAVLREEMRRRSPAWRPAWAGLLSERTAYAPPRPGPPGRPSVPPLRITPERRVALIDEIADRMRFPARNLDWSRLRLTYRALVGYAGGELVATCADGDHDLPLPEGVRAAMEALRSVTYVEGRGAWFTVDVVVGRTSGWRVAYDRDGEPAFSMPPRAFDHALDARYFPRDFTNTPPWLVERLRPDAP